MFCARRSGAFSAVTLVKGGRPACQGLAHRSILAGGGLVGTKLVCQLFERELSCDRGCFHSHRAAGVLNDKTGSAQSQFETMVAKKAVQLFPRLRTGHEELRQDVRLKQSQHGLARGARRLSHS